MKLFIFKTDIQTENQLDQLRLVIQNQAEVARWTIDMEDVDHVLKVETKVDAHEAEMLQILRARGIECEQLPD